MDALAIDLLAALLALTALYGRPATVLTVLIGTVMLIPTTLVTPHLHTSYATVDHVVIGAAALRMAALARRGDLSRDVFRATPLHLAFALLIVTWATVGVVLAPASQMPALAEQRMVDLAFTLAFFVVTLAVIRQLNRPMLVMRLLTGTLAITAGIAIIEHVTKNAYGHWLFNVAGHPGPTDAAHSLETRAGHVRVRASGEFALAYAWVAVMLLPAATITMLRTRARRLLPLGLAVVVIAVLAIFWTYSRSAAAAVPIVFVVLALAVRDRRTMIAGGLTAVGALVLFAANATVHHHLSLSTDQGSVGIRFQRLPPILEAVSHHAYLGLGLGGLESISVSTTDNFYLNAYAETGVIGAAVLVAVCITSLVQTVRGITVTDRTRRAVIGASVLGFVAFLASGLFDDALLLGQPSQLAMLFLATATATAEPELGYTLLPKWSTPRVLFLTAIGALTGLAAYLVSPVVVSQERTFTTVSTLGTVLSGGGGVGQPLIDTVCNVAKAITPSLPQTHIDCRDNYTAPGVGTLRVESPTAEQTLHAYTTLSSVLGRAYYFSDYQTLAAGPPVAARATAWDTAPTSGAVLGFALAFIAPLPLRRRRLVDDEPTGPAAPSNDDDATPQPATGVATVGTTRSRPTGRAPEERLVPPQREIPALDPD